MIYFMQFFFLNNLLCLNVYSNRVLLQHRKPDQKYVALSGLLCWMCSLDIPVGPCPPGRHWWNSVSSPLASPTRTVYSVWGGWCPSHIWSACPRGRAGPGRPSPARSSPLQAAARPNCRFWRSALATPQPSRLRLPTSSSAAEQSLSSSGAAPTFLRSTDCSMKN